MAFDKNNIRTWVIYLAVKPKQLKFLTFIFWCTLIHVPVGHAKFDVNRCNESPLWAKNLIFSLWVNLIPAFCGFANPASKKTNHIYSIIAGARCTIFPKLCMTIELVQANKKVVIHFLIQCSFSLRAQWKIRPNWPTRGFSAITP